VEHNWRFAGHSWVHESDIWVRGLGNMKNVHHQHITSLLTRLKISDVQIQNGCIFTQLLPLRKKKQ
jgi:hypothetical protein